KEAARALVHARLSVFNQHYQLQVKKVFIRNQKTRWGSCSSRGNLNFNYRLAMLPLHLVDYVVVHELCHLGQFNHSPAFWALVEKTLPNYKALRAELKQQKM
ncbi:MAG: putative metal-dependent hydrolase, partial [Candidatus Adlerbacteria bacterium]|nr:putative metal-dependent hydrolase [Candidatus Adlerbacteria bacterium]